VKDALDLADQFGEIVLTEFLHDVAELADAELLDEGDEVRTARVLLAVRTGTALVEEELPDVGLVVEALN
jgi:hypothetical protein